MKNKISFLLIITLLTMSLFPLIAASYFLKSALSSQEHIYKSPKLNSVLDRAQTQLKKFSKIDPNDEASYRELFDDIQDTKLIYGEDPFFSRSLRHAFSKYFFYGFGLALLISLTLGLILSKLINNIYQRSYLELEASRIRATYLEEIARWQDIAKTLAHELRRPLQPIGIWVSNLR